MKVELQQKASFEASHVLRNMPEGHKCRRLHGHRYTVTIAVAGDIVLGAGDGTDILVDYLELESQLSAVCELLDHRHLNDISERPPYHCQPTVEWLVKWLWDRLQPHVPYLCRVEVQETETATCVYRGP